MKMVQPYQIPTITTLILVLLLSPSLEAKKLKRKIICPIGFQIAYSNIKGEPICYRLKGPEKLTDKYKGCMGNLYTTKLYNSLNISKTDLVLWTEYKSLYPGGPFIDYSFTKSTGALLETTFEVENPQRFIDEELCVVVDPVANFTATRCDEEYYRYCFVEPYVDEEAMSKEGCEGLKGPSWRFWAPKATCLSPATAVGGGAVRATWIQAKEICEKKGGTVLYNGWRYSNNPLLHVSGSFPVYPLGITYDSQRQSHIVNEDATLLDCGGWFPFVSPSVTQSPFELETWGCCRYDSGKQDSCGNTSQPLYRDVWVLTPPAEWGLQDKIDMISGNETSYGVVRNGLWDLVNSSYIFFDVICERNVALRKVDLVVSADEQNKLILTVSDNVNENNLYCFTDSESFTPTPVKISFDDIHNKLLTFILKPIVDGYYWCVHIDSKRFIVSESNKALWVREEQSLRYNYAVKMVFNKEYRFDNLDRLNKIWEKKLKEYIFYSTNYYNLYGYLEQTKNPKAFEEALSDFKATHPDLNPKEKDVIYGMKLKKVFLDKKTVLVHLQLNPRMRPAQPGTWEDIEIVYMKPVYYCIADNHEFIESITVQCQIHTCVGNFNDGVQVVTTIDEDCFQSTELPTMYRNEVSLLIPTPAVQFEQTTGPRDTNSDSSEETTEIPKTMAPPIWPKPPVFPPLPTTTVDTEIIIVPNVTETVVTASITTETVITANITFTTDVPTTTPMLTEPPTSPAPEDQLQQVMYDLENLINNSTAPVFVENISSAFDQVDGLLAENMELNIPGELLHLLDGIGSRLNLGGFENATTIRDNIALLVTDAEPNLPVRGLRIAARENDTFTDGAFEIIRDDFDTSHLQQERSEAVVKLPDSVANSSRRISFVVFRNDRAFHPNTNNQYLVNSRVLSVNVENLTKFDAGETVDIHFSSLIGDPDRNQSRTCAFWHFVEGGGGYWSQEGCTFIRASRPGMLDTCRCDHLTHFAEILIPRTVFSERNEQILELLSIIGCCVSLFGLVMIGVTATLFRSWRKDFSNKIWLQLCIAIMLLVICFLVIIFARFDNYDIPCMLVGVLLHYSVLASFCWMLVAAVLSYRRLVLVFTRDASHKLLRASAFSWGAPCAVVGILLSVAPHSYAGRFEEKTPTGAFCYPSGLGLWLAVYAPIAIMLLANWTLFVLIVRSVFASRRIQRHGDSNEALRCASVSCLLVFLFGLPWIFGLFASNVVLAYLFALTATYQGFVLFIFFVVGNKKTRDLWLNKLKIKQTRKVPVTSSTYTNRSTGPGWRGAVTTSVEAKASKPRSLSSADDSRFS